METSRKQPIFTPNFQMIFSKEIPPERIYLIGFMGSGKTFTGKKLAGLLGWDFIDLDEKIESVEGMAIPEIFQKKGETHFRQLEQAALRETFFLTKTVVATGGGTPCFFENMNEMQQNGLVIYLKTAQKLLVERLASEPGNRPLIAEKSEKELFHFIKAMFRERNVVYLQANLIFPIKKTDPELLGNILKKLAEFSLEQK